MIPEAFDLVEKYDLYPGVFFNYKTLYLEKC